MRVSFERLRVRNIQWRIQERNRGFIAKINNGTSIFIDLYFCLKSDIHEWHSFFCKIIVINKYKLGDLILFISKLPSHQSNITTLKQDRFELGAHIILLTFYNCDLFAWATSRYFQTVSTEMQKKAGLEKKLDKTDHLGLHWRREHFCETHNACSVWKSRSNGSYNWTVVFLVHAAWRSAILHFSPSEKKRHVSFTFTCCMLAS